MHRRYHRRARAVRLSLRSRNLMHLKQRLEPPQIFPHRELRVFPKNCSRHFAQRPARRRIFHFRGHNRSAIPRRPPKLHRAPVLEIRILRRSPRQKLVLPILSDLRVPAQPLPHRTNRRPLRPPVAPLAYRFQVAHENRQILQPSPHSKSRLRLAIYGKAGPRPKLRRAQRRSPIRQQSARRSQRDSRPSPRQRIHRQCPAAQQHSPPLQRFCLRPAVARIAPHFRFPGHFRAPRLIGKIFCLPKYFASSEFAHQSHHRDKAVPVFECRLCLTAPQAKFIEMYIVRRKTPTDAQSRKGLTRGLTTLRLKEVFTRMRTRPAFSAANLYRKFLPRLRWPSPTLPVSPRAKLPTPFPTSARRAPRG